MKLNPLSELSKKYAELLTLAYTVKINIFDENRAISVTTCAAQQSLT